MQYLVGLNWTGNKELLMRLLYVYLLMMRGCPNISIFLVSQFNLLHKFTWTFRKTTRTAQGGATGQEDNVSNCAKIYCRTLYDFSPISPPGSSLPCVQ